MDVSKVLKEALSELEKSNSEDSIQNIRVKYLGKKGLITDLLKSLKELSVEEKMYSELQLRVWIKHFNMLIEIEELKKEILEDSGFRE
jgi:phenylalanyl-tRNA synthetase alpha subunit